MKFVDKYAWVKPGEVVGDILRCDKADNCCECGTLTPFAEVNAEAYFCSDECVEKFYHDFYMANRRIVEKYKSISGSWDMEE